MPMPLPILFRNLLPLSAFSAFPYSKVLLCCPWFSNVYPPKCLVLSLLLSFSRNAVSLLGTPLTLFTFPFRPS
ncbi:hypothetical protein F4809DRAFT_630153 [Biscogniauxia mediterranea]|nr:hypothetical protein F4809DRAFT_630153 [Biscogniauxia mediterranea]